jgi:hypothetical protein
MNRQFMYIPCIVCLLVFSQISALSQTFKNADFVGTWDYHQITSGTNAGEAGWEYGIINIDASGSATVSGTDSDGKPAFFVGNNIVSVNADGIISSTVVPGFHGKLYSSKDLMVYTYNHGDGGYALEISMKREKKAKGNVNAIFQLLLLE